jgi:hypothetical protein
MANGQRCFLDDPAWNDVLLATMKPEATFAPRSHLGIFLGSRMTRMPGLFRDITHAVCRRETISPAALEGLVNRGLELRSDLVECRSMYDDLVKTAGRKKDQGARHEIFGLSLTVSVIINRLLGAIWPSQRNTLEDECLDLAQKLKALDEVGADSPKVAFYLTQKNRMMDAMVRTTGLWRDRDGEEGEVIQKWKFDAWCSAIPRKTCNGRQCQPKRCVAKGVEP